ncbi:hypothetical protein T10_3416 [Trichinella papuae]|uniref:Uncharacterized protein n=1 Tax=Trichinella papuae TaxID=268474 RepID=A0A0V1MHE9_9BILA|nr:hypothetical protein T10_3416 [Trichinella papuae]
MTIKTKTRYHKILSNNADRALLAAEKNCSGRNGADLVGVIFPLTGGHEAWLGQWHCRSTALKIAFARSDNRDSPIDPKGSISTTLATPALESPPQDETME